MDILRTIMDELNKDKTINLILNDFERTSEKFKDELKAYTEDYPKINVILKEEIKNIKR